MEKSLSLKNRLIAAATAWIAFGLVLSWIVLSNVFHSHVSEQFYDELFVHLAELQRLAKVEGGKAVLRAPLSDPRYEVENSGYYWEIQQNGNVLARSLSMTAAPLRTPQDSRADVDVHTHTIAGPTGTLLVAEKLDWKDPAAAPVQFILGTDKRHLDAVVASFSRVLSWSLSGLGLSMVLASALLIAYAMRPLNHLHEALVQVRKGETQTLAGRHPVEVQPLVDSLNALLLSSSDLVQRARTQAGNIAHGIKTPLAILVDEARRLKLKGQDSSAAAILDQCRRMQTQIDYHTTRARVVANRATHASALVSEAANDIAAALSRLYRDRGVKFGVAIDADLRVACDKRDLQELLGNLADNAGKHARSHVSVAARKEDDGFIEITVGDDGPGLPPEAYEVVFNVGERWDTQEAGTGLGLAITRDLVTLYGGTVTLGRSQEGGLLATIRLPEAT